MVLYIWLSHKSVSFAFGFALGWRLFLHNFFNPNPFIHQLQQKFVQSVYHPITNKLSSHDFHFLKDWNCTVIIKGELTKDFGIILEVLNKLEHEVIDQKKKRLNCVIERLKTNTSLTFIDPNCCLVLYYFQNKWCLMLRRSIIISYTENISHCRDTFFFGALWKIYN